MKARIISEQCIGCGQCEETTDGKVFKIDENGIAVAVVDEIPEELLDDAQMAESGCPTGAVVVEEDNKEIDDIENNKQEIKHQEADDKK